MKPKLISILCFLTTATLLTTGCKDDDDVQPNDTFKIGVMIPLTGSASSSGESIDAALDIALKDVQDYLESIGSPLDIELIIKDTGSDPSISRQRLQELLDADVKFVIGPYSSAEAAVVLDDANTNDLFVLSPSSVATALAISGDNLYRLVPSDRNQAEAIAALFAHDSIETVIPVVRDDVWGNGLLSDAFIAMTQQNVLTYSTIMYHPENVNSTDIASQVATAISSLTPQQLAHSAVYLMSFGEGTDILNAAAQESNNSLVNWYGSSAFANNGDLLQNNTARMFAQEQSIRCPSFRTRPRVDGSLGSNRN